MNTHERPLCLKKYHARRLRAVIGGLVCSAISFLSVHTASAQFDPNNPIPAVIPHGPLRVELRPIATGLTSPILVTFAPDKSGRIFVVEQSGQVWIYKKGVRSAVPFIDVANRMVTLNPGYDERGLLGLAFDPGFANRQSPGFRRIFTYSSEPVAGTADLTDPYATALNHHGVVASWRVSAANPDVVDPATRVEILRIDQPQSNHNGGTVAFGPDGFLYLGLGDGGGANDNNPNGHNPTIGNGQDATIALGKMLRIDVNGTGSANGKYGIPPTNPFAGGGGVPEIYALGFRNPYRFSFDSNDLLVADVGQNKVEELDRVEVGKNYGWRYKEGTFKFNTDGTVSDDLTGIPDGLTDPILQYDHDEGISITGGYVYRGTAIPPLVGKYVFGDFSMSFGSPTGRLFYADLTTGEIREFTLGIEDASLGLFVKGMGIDADGEIYVLGTTNLGPSGTTGVVLKLTSFSSFGVPSINDAGEIAYLGRFATTDGDRTVIVAPENGEGPNHVVLIGSGDPVPDASASPVAGETFRSFSDPLLAADGSVTFIARTTAPGSSDRGIWTNAGTGILHLLAREGDEAEGLPGARFKTFSSIAAGNSGESETLIAFTANVVGSGAKSGANLGLWLSQNGGPPVLALRKAQQLTIRSESRKVKSINALTPEVRAPGQGRGVAAGKVAVQVTFTNKTEAILQFDPTGAFDVIAATGDSVLSTTLERFSPPTQSADGRPAFIAHLAGTPHSKHSAVIVQASDLSLELVAETAQQAPGTDGSFVGFDSVVHGSDSGVAFLARIGGGATKGSSNTGVWRKLNGTTELIAREGSDAPGVPGGKWLAFRSIALPDSAAAGPLIVADLRPGYGINMGNRTGLWGVDSTGELKLLLRTGSPVEFQGEAKTLRAFTILSLVPGSPTQTRAFNSAGQLIYRAFFTDKSQAILTLDIP